MVLKSMSALKPSMVATMLLLKMLVERQEDFDVEQMDPGEI